MSTANDGGVKFGDIENLNIQLMLHWLSPRDLLECGRSCKRLQKLCREQFLREYSMNEVHIKFRDDGTLNVTPCAKHFSYYDHVIRNVSITSWTFEKNTNLKLENLTNFMLKKCSKELDKIYIVGDMDLVQFGQNVRSILQNVKTVGFQNRKGAVDVAQFLQCCPEMTKLTLGVGVSRANADAILQQRYKVLTHFCYTYGDAGNLNPETLKAFFQRHETLKSVVWKFRMCDESTRIYSIRCIRTLAYTRHLKHVMFSFSDQLPKYTTQQFDVIRSQLTELCGRDEFRTLEIEMICPRHLNHYTPAVLMRMRGFADWEKLTKIHLYHYPLYVMIPTLRMLANLRTMILNDCLYYEPDDESTDQESDSSNDTSDNAPMALPQVQDLFIRNGSYDDLTEVCILPIKYWRNLRRILAPVIINSIRLDIVELNRARETLSNACEVTIFTNNKNLPTNLQHNLVKLKLVDTVNMALLHRR